MARVRDAKREAHHSMQMAQQLSLLEMLVALTRERDALEALLELTPDSHREQVRVVLMQVQLALSEVTSALVLWTPR